VKFVGTILFGLCLGWFLFYVRLKKPLDSDLELRSFILRRQEEVQAYTYATKAAEVFTDCLVVVGAPEHPVQS